MALPVPYCLGAKISLQGIKGRNSQGGAELRPGLLQQDKLSGSRTECARRPCALAGEGTAKSSDISVGWNSEGEDGVTNIYAVFVFTAKALLGQSLLGKRLLRRYGRNRCRDDTEVCKVSGKAGTTSDSNEPETINEKRDNSGQPSQKAGYTAPFQGA